ncbi:MAG: PAS domain-containing protein [Gammaproteobacteria bacterium]|nr:PAS domain-containing protein [Gammaproteobacteria bacterium]
MKNVLKPWSTVGASGAIMFAILGLVGYLPGMGLLGSVRESYIPMAPSTAVNFIILGFVLLVLNIRRYPGAKVTSLMAITFLVSLFGVLEVAGYFSGIDLNFEDILVPAVGKLNGVPIARMSPATGGAFFLSGTAVFFLIFKRKFPEGNTLVEYFVSGLGFLVLLISFSFCLAYFYGMPLLYGLGATIPMALTTALGFAFLSISILTAEGDAFPLRFLTETSTRSYLLRFILPLSVLSVVFGGVAVLFLMQMTKINPALISSALTVVVIIITGFIATLISRHMGSALDRSKETAKQANEALRKSERRYQVLAEVSPVGIFRTDAAGNCLYVNERWCMISGMTFEDAQGEGWIHGIHSDDRKRVFEEWLLAFDNSLPFQSEYRFRTPEGVTKWVLGQARADLNENGVIVGYVGTITDITERKHTEETVHNIAVGVSSQIGEAFFQSLAIHLAKTFNAKYTFIGLLDKQRPGTVDTVALCIQGEVVDGPSYELVRSPCEHVVGVSSSCGVQAYPRDIQYLFPDDPMLKEMGAQSYVGAPLVDTTGKPIGLIVVMDDKPMENAGMVGAILKIFAVRVAAELERLWVEQALRDSEAGLAEAQRMARIGNWELDLVTNKLEWSEEIYRIFEVDPWKIDVTFGTYLDLMHPDDREQVETAYTASLKNKLPYNIAYRIRMPDGKIKHVMARCETFYDDTGNAVRSVGTVQDITEQYQTEQTLRRLNRSLKALSACNEVLVRAEDEAELLNKVCRIIVEISGYRLAWVGFAEHDEAKTVKPMAQAGYDEGYLETVNLTWADTERGQGPTGIAIRSGKLSIIRNILEDPRYIPWRQSALKHGYRSSVALPLKNKEQTFGVLNIYAHEESAFDDEEEVRLLQELADDLAYGIVTLRSHKERHQLNIQLRQAQKMEAIGQLTGGIAHDFNNILASILGFTSLALQRFANNNQPELREYLNEVSQAGERARDLVSQMLAFSRTGSSTVSRVPISPMIKEVVKMLHSTLPSSIELSGHCDTDVPAVMMEPVQLQQVLMNVCINARDAVGGKGRLDIRARRVRIRKNSNQEILQSVPSNAVLRCTCDACHIEIASGNYVELSVQDTGTGISVDELERIFEPFFTTKDVDKGTGMGLSMVYGIIHQHEGHILVDTELGLGTTFRLLLPIAEGVSIHEPGAQSDVKLIPKNLKGARILIVDDEESIGRFMGSLLENRGGKITVLTESRAALDLFSQDPAAFDLIITDQTMPGLTGVELAQKVMALRPELPVILCTGYSEQVDEVKSKALGIRGYLTKPMEIKTLFNMVVKLLAV